MVRSCLYVGRVRHRRLEPVAHAFSYRLFMTYLDLDELPRLFDDRWLWSARGFAPAWFRREDYLGDPEVPLAEAVKDLVEERLGRRPAGPVRLLTHLRYLGYAFNPLSLYHCFEPDGETVAATVAEVTSTPWRERHAYVVGPGRRHEVRKALHVSPFMGMDQRYRWRLTEPGARLGVHMESVEAGRVVFDATLALRREEITGRSLARALVRFPFMTGRVIAAIYLQALRLRLKGARFHPHPRRTPCISSTE
jgi:hypothetical protein